MRMTSFKCHILRIVICLLSLVGKSYAGEAIIQPIALVYPVLQEPFRTIFSQMAQGVEEKASSQLRKFSMASPSDMENVAEKLKQQKPRVLIALGKQGLKVATGLEKDMTILVGGILNVPESDTRQRVVIISLAPDPAKLFQRMKEFRPTTKRIWVLYDPKHNEWLMKWAIIAAKDQDIELVARPVSDIASAVQVYQTIFKEWNKATDALWLPQDPTSVEEGTLLPLILKEAWEKEVPVFSSYPHHVKKGVLFSLYPDNIALGHKLAAMAIESIKGEKIKAGVYPLGELLLSVNKRTLSHIKLTMDGLTQKPENIFSDRVD